MKTADPGQESLWTAKQVAQYLNVSLSWVYHRAEAGLLPCFRLGPLLRFDPSAIRTLLGRQEQPGQVLHLPGARGR